MKRARPHDHESGVILPSVLIILALASAIVMMMITLQELAIQRSRRFNEAAQSSAYAQGGVLSVIVALRRDGGTAPETDNLTEPWATIADTKVPIENGTFTLAVRDAQARFNVNDLATADLAGQKNLASIVQSLRMPASTALRLSAFLKANGPVASLAELAQAGLNRAELATLSQMVVALPLRSTININTADEALIGAVLGNRPAARQLVARRERQGYLTADDISAARTILPPGVGFTSDFYEVETSVTIGDTVQGAATLLQRRIKNGVVTVAAIRRANTKAAPLPAPPPQ